MSRHGVQRLIIVCCVFALLGAIFLWYERQPARVLSSELAAAGVSGTVTVDGEPYEIENGTVTGPHAASSTIAYRALKTMYALTLAKRAPLFDLEGVDPDALASSTETLASLQRTLASFQTTNKGKKSIGELYPISFLRALAQLERARERFIASGSESDGAAYESLLTSTAQSGLANIESFDDAFESSVGTSTFRIADAGGTYTEASMKDSVQAIEARMREVQAELQTRDRCIAGESSACASDLDPPAPPAAASWHADATRYDLAREVLGLFQDAIGLAPGEDTMYVLSSSSCMAELPGPYYFAYTAPNHDATVPFRFIGDLLFSSTASSSEVSRFLADAYGISYNQYNPFTYYSCPEYGSDVSRLIAIRSIALFANAHPEINVPARERIVSGAVYEWDAYAYLDEAQKSASLNGQTRAEIERLALMAKDKSAGLDVVIAKMTNVLSREMAEGESGAPIEYFKDAPTMIEAETPLPSLYLSYSPAFGETPVTLSSPNAADAAQFFKTFQPYSRLEGEVPRETLVRDLREHQIFEGMKP